MVETPNLTSDQKEKNKQYVLDHLDEYTFDIQKNLVNVAPDTEGDEWYFCFGKDCFTPEGHQEIKVKMYEKILKEINDWEISNAKNGVEYIKHRPTGKIMYIKAFGFYRFYIIVGEIGYRKNIWAVYDEKTRKKTEEDIKWNEVYNNDPINRANSRLKAEQRPKTEPDNWFKDESYETENNKRETQNQEKQNNNNTPDQSNPPSKQQPQDQPTNNPLPSTSDIQTNYDSDKGKSVIANNSNLINLQEQQQANELLKVIITAELLVKKSQFNSEILTQLLTIKNNQPSIYQLLNKEGRIEQAINQLQKVEKVQPNGNSGGHNNQNQNPLPLGIMIVGSILVIAGLGTIILVRKKNQIKARRK